MLTRHHLASGAYLDHFRSIHAGLCWSRQRMRHSLRTTLRQRPRSGQDEIWVFGYGSLIWNPLLHVAQRHWGRLEGWQRSFSLRMTAGRATVERPGRMLTVVPGSRTDGVLLRLADEQRLADLDLLWMREMPTGAYVPSWLPVTRQDGRRVLALVFVADTTHPLHDGEAGAAEVAPLIAAARGPHGSNADYLLRLDRELAMAGFPDPGIRELADTVRALLPAPGRP